MTDKPMLALIAGSDVDDADTLDAFLAALGFHPDQETLPLPDVERAASSPEPRRHATTRQPVGTVGGRGGVMADWARPVVHWEIEAHDPERQRAFYRALFNWDIGDGPIMNVGAGLGGPEPGPAGHIRQGERPGVHLYVQVLDIRASLARAVELGGLQLSEPFDVPGGPTIAFIADPEGNGLALVQQ